MNTSIPFPLCCIIIIFLACSCNKKTPPKKTIENNTPVKEFAQKDSLKDIRDICIHGFQNCTNIQNGYYRKKFGSAGYPELLCQKFSTYITINEHNSDLSTNKYGNAFGRCINDLQWPIDSVIKYLGKPYKIAPRYTPDHPDIQVGTHLFYCEKIGEDSIDCSRAERGDFSRAVFVPKWK